MLDTMSPAVDVALAVAGKLEDPEHVVTTATAPGNAERLSDDLSRSLWTPASFGCGHSGLAVLFAELSAVASRPIGDARAHMVAAARQVTSLKGRSGLFFGVAGLALAADAVAKTGVDCGPLAQRCVDHVARVAQEAADEALRDLDSLRYSQFDVIGGVTGVARVLLRIAGGDDERVHALTRFLVAITEPRVVRGAVLPGWFATGPVGFKGDTYFDEWHLNSGVAHGVAGILAYLALAKRDGVRIAGHDEAIERTVAWLLAHRDQGRHGLGWPSVVSFAEENDGLVAASGDRGAWCYGTPGIARTLQLAAVAMGRSDWAAEAVSAMQALLDVALHGQVPLDMGLCHGWAGLLRITDLMIQDASGEPLRSFGEALRRHVLDGFDADSAFGYRADLLSSRLPANDPGVLGGAAGTALALASPRAQCSVTGWEDAFLLT
ncbi:lanthionine synthetase C family protein [Phytohabitans suffuscus]|uniref:Lanthionine synthetase n=1 Tax=Phytohabitans suffuscus TaxID=624315 RepID=A0A6F8YFW9_9ACTN|nr:lanthionine synthetase C family protein [Phytohabitans suffuscus]BCB84992.1 hypothetical protein Psuf_023050 [Phytohabitans suffuscus]